MSENKANPPAEDAEDTAKLRFRFHRLLNIPGSAKQICEIYESTSPGNRAYISESLGRACQSNSRTMRLNASAAILGVMEDFSPEVQLAAVEYVLDSVSFWWGKEARRIRSTAKRMFREFAREFWKQEEAHGEILHQSAPKAPLQNLNKANWTLKGTAARSANVHPQGHNTKERSR